MPRRLMGGLLVCGLVLFHCSEPTETETKPPSPPAMVVVAGPRSANAPAEIMQKANEITNYFTFISTTLQDISGVTPESNGNIYNWQVAIDAGTMIMKVKAVRRSDQSVDWTVIFDGLASDSTLYVNRTIFIGKVGAKNRSQSWTFYDIFSGAVTQKISWIMDGDNHLTVHLSMEAIKAVWQIVNRADYSGLYRFEQDGTERFVAQWISDGSGTYTDKTGSVPQTGTWD